MTQQFVIKFTKRVMLFILIEFLFSFIFLNYEIRYRCAGEGLPLKCESHCRPEEGVRCPGAVVTVVVGLLMWVLGSELSTAEPLPVIPHF